MSPRILISVALAIGSVAIGGFLWSRREASDARRFVTASVERSAIIESVTATGTLNAVTTVAVGTYVSGPIRAIHVDWNSPVRRGQVVAQIDPDPFNVKVERAQAGLATARARVQRAEADLDFKRLGLERKRKLVRDNVLSQDSLEAQESSFRQAGAQLAVERASVAEAQALLDEARINLSYTDIVSPVDGVVLSRNVDVGQTVAASFQTPTLFLIAEDLTKMRVNASISESDIGRVRNGQATTFTVDAYPERVFEGEVSQRRDAPIILSNVVTYDVIVDVDNPDLDLKPGMTATVTIKTDSRDDVLVVPLRALRFRPEEADRPGSEDDSEAGGSDASGGPPAEAKPSVWVLGPDGLGRVEVTTGIRNDRRVEIVSGALAAGDTLAVAYERE